MGCVMSPQYVDVPYLKRQDTTFLARLWSPPSHTEIKAVVVDVHGGAWCDHDRTSGHFYDKQLAAAGFAVVAIDFRCGPEFHHPAASIDVNAAVQWARFQARQLDAVSKEIVTIGSSSGGHLALLAALRPDALDGNGTDLWIDGEWTPQTSVDGRVPAVGVFWAPVDPLARYFYAKSLNNELGRRLTENSIAYFQSPDAMHDASIARIVSEEPIQDLPKIWFAQAGKDENVPAALIKTLRLYYESVGGSFSLENYQESGHGFAHSDSEDSQRFIKDLVSWLDSVLER